ncbi:MAG: hypothetical protein AAGG11_14295 [Pseudomonadota bacterium]
MTSSLKTRASAPRTRATALDLRIHAVFGASEAASWAYATVLQWLERHSHWLLRVPLAALLWGYGAAKFPAAISNPGDFGVPAPLYTLNAFGEVLGVIALLVGGGIETLNPNRSWLRFLGDLMTRAAGFALAAAIAGVIVFFLWGTITLSNSHTMMLGLALYFMLRGNRLAGPNRSKRR